jgi:hypothetical protein
MQTTAYTSSTTVPVDRHKMRALFTEVAEQYDRSRPTYVFTGAGAGRNY